MKKRIEDITILSIDPGTTQSGFVLTTEYNVLNSGVGPNDSVLEILETSGVDVVLVEELTNTYGHGVSRDVMRSQFWAGGFFVTAIRNGFEAISIPRSKTASYFRPEGRSRAKDSDIRRAIIARYPASGGGSTPEVGTKSQPGPLYGVTDDAWQALGLVVYYLEHHQSRLPVVGCR